MINAALTRFKKYLATGIKSENPPDVNRQIYVANLFSFMGYTITFLMGVSAVFRPDYILAFSLFLASTLFYLSHYILKFDGIKSGYKFSSRTVLSCLLALMLYLVYTGGHTHTGPLWMYIVPPVAFFFGGLKRGIWVIASYITLVSIMLFYPDNALLATDYSHEFKTRLIYSFLTVASLFAFYEFSRQKTYKELHELSQKFERQARQDSLTNLPNRRGMMEHLEYEFNRSRRSRQEMSVLLCDIDNFKQVNDTYGHDFGDKVLMSISDVFHQAMRKQDIVARWGGEEFLFLLPETNAKDAYTLAEKIRQKVSSHVTSMNDRTLSVTVSLGVSPVNDEVNVQQAISLADHFLYQAKAHGRNKTMPEPQDLGSPTN